MQLLLESEFIRNQEVLKPKAERETEQRDKVSCFLRQDKKLTY